jgi:DNA-binding NarL/FixJ family response regulator
LIKVLVVDDHDLVRSGIVRLLSDAKGINVIGEANCGEDAVKLSRELDPDVVLMDINMPGIGGLEATRKLVRSNADIKVIAVTACDDGPYASRLMQAGAAGFMGKGAEVDEMVRAILKVRSGQRYISPDIAQRMALKPFQEGSDSPFDVLSEREMQTTLMIIGCNKVQEISDKLCVSPKTVNSYRYRIFEKLGIDGDVELTILAMKHGILDTQAAL